MKSWIVILIVACIFIIIRTSIVDQNCHITDEEKAVGFVDHDVFDKYRKFIEDEDYNAASGAIFTIFFDGQGHIV